ncbi:mitochondrial ribosomal subunit protein-domain-containing protein [Phlyctochytrium arcticum]|nr:mitochondrial ribosomal subunit protein-domain-containing protein [Phlyctochytrium arcticum]
MAHLSTTTMSLARVLRRGCAKSASSLALQGISRGFSSSSPTFARKLGGQNERRGGDKDIATITGDLDKDGVHRFEMDFLETAEWTKDLLLKMQNDVDMLKEKLKPYEAPPAEHVVTTYTDRYAYDFTQPLPYDTRVVLQVQSAKLNLSDPEKHKFLLLAGKSYDPYSDVITLEVETGESARTGDAKADREENRLALARRLEAMIKQAKDTKDSFTDVPLDLRHIKPKKNKLDFPEEWLRPKKTAPLSS